MTGVARIQGVGESVSALDVCIKILWKCVSKTTRMCKRRPTMLFVSSTVISSNRSSSNEPTTFFWQNEQANFCHLFYVYFCQHVRWRVYKYRTLGMHSYKNNAVVWKFMKENLLWTTTYTFPRCPFLRMQPQWQGVLHVQRMLANDTLRSCTYCKLHTNADSRIMTFCMKIHMWVARKEISEWSASVWSMSWRVFKIGSYYDNVMWRF